LVGKREEESTRGGGGGGGGAELPTWRERDGPLGRPEEGGVGDGARDEEEEDAAAEEEEP